MTRKHFVIAVVILTVIVFIPVGTAIKSRIEIFAQKAKVQEAERAVWAVVAVAGAMNSDIYNACRTDIYLPSYHIPASAIDECKLVRSEKERFEAMAISTAEKYRKELGGLDQLMGRRHQ